MSYMDRKCSDTKEKQMKIMFFLFLCSMCIYTVYLAVATITLIWLRLIADAFLDCLSICLNYCSILSYISPYVLTEQKSRICSLKCN